MQIRWEDKNVDLALLTSHICDFLKDKDFEIVQGETSRGYGILAGDSPEFKLQGYIDIEIEGDPDDFTVGFSLEGRKEGPRISPFLLDMFGGGYFHLQRLRSTEAWITLEKEFKKYLQSVLRQLTGSAKLSH